MAEMKPRKGDAFGMALLAHMDQKDGWHVVERDDGRLHPMDAEVYFREPADWPNGEPRVLDYIRGRVLDVGAGAGRYAVELQRRGHHVVALDVSAGAAEVCQRRGLVNVFTGTIDELGDDHFDTFLFGGNNLGLLASPSAASRLLDRLRTLALPNAQIIGTCRDPYDTDDPENLEYHELNRSRGRQAGQIRLRVRFRRVATPWFDYWFQSPSELRTVTEPHGWSLRHYEPLAFGSYLAVLDARP
jgi:SAM-dependent methyltransferase